MKRNTTFSRSSLLVSLPVLAILLLCCVLAAFFGQGRLAFVLMFAFLLAGASRLWAVAMAMDSTPAHRASASARVSAASM